MEPVCAVEHVLQCSEIMGLCPAYEGLSLLILGVCSIEHGSLVGFI